MHFRSSLVGVAGGVSGARGAIKTVNTLLHRVPRRWLLLQIRLLAEGRVLSREAGRGVLHERDQATAVPNKTGEVIRPSSVP